MILFMIVTLLISCDGFLVMLVLHWRTKALTYHKQADERLQALEPMRMSRDEWEQRCAYVTGKLAEFERRGSATG